MSTVAAVAQHRVHILAATKQGQRCIYISSKKWYPEVSCCLRARLYPGPMRKHSSICGRIKSKNLTLSIKEKFWTKSRRLLKTLPPTAGNVSTCGEESACPTSGQPLGADILPHLQRAAFRNGLQGIHLGRQHHVELHLLSCPPAGRIPSTWWTTCLASLCSHADITSAKVSLALDILAGEAYKNPTESPWSREMRTTPSFYIWLGKGYRSQTHSQQWMEDFKVTQPEHSKPNRASELNSPVDGCFLKATGKKGRRTGRSIAAEHLKKCSKRNTLLKK